MALVSVEASEETKVIEMRRMQLSFGEGLRRELEAMAPRNPPTSDGRHLRMLMRDSFGRSLLLKLDFFSRMPTQTTRSRRSPAR
jgi:hypothetical protein